jgi:Kef-type K+ transport system membrane component KefB
MIQPHSVPFVVSLLLLLLSARILGEIFERFGKPSMIGEVLAGVILGPSLLGLVYTDPQIKAISDLAVFLLVILAGLEISFDELREAVRRRYIWISLLGFSIPMVSGLLMGLCFHYKILFAIFLGLCIAITALPVSVRILMDLGILRTQIGRQIISAAVFNDVISLLVLGIILDLEAGKLDTQSLVMPLVVSILKVVLLVVLLVLLYQFYRFTKRKIKTFHYGMDRVLHFLKSKESLFALVIVFSLLFSSVTELLGLHFIIGAFFGAMMISPDILGKRNYMRVKNNTSVITMGFLAPVFFATIGLEFEFKSINSVLLPTVVIIVSFLSKVVGGYLGGRLAKFNHYDSVSLGVGLNARGIMELVIANIALTNHFIDRAMFSVLVLMGVLTTLVTPVMLKYAIDKNHRNPIRLRLPWHTNA